MRHPEDTIRENVEPAMGRTLESKQSDIASPRPADCRPEVLNPLEQVRKNARVPVPVQLCARSQPSEGLLPIVLEVAFLVHGKLHKLVYTTYCVPRPMPTQTHRVKFCTHVVDTYVDITARTAMFCG
jgi:hypothetical protein